MDTVKCMRAFVSVAANGSFTAAAERLGLSTNLVSKYVRQLEDRLGTQLMVRTTRSLALTDNGRAYLQRCSPLLDQFDEMEREIHERQSELVGLIRITAPTGFGSRELVKILEPFQREHSKVSIQLHLADHNISMVDEGIDLAIRFGALDDSSLVARKLADMRRVVVASPNYLAEHGIPDHPNDLSAHNCLLQLASPDPRVWKFKMDGADLVVKIDGSFKANSPRAIAHMAARGLGIGRCPYYTAQPFIDRGFLETLFQKEEAEQSPLYAVYPPNRHLSSRLRALIDHLSENF